MLFRSRGRQDVISAEELNEFRCNIEQVRADLDEHFEAININTEEQEVQNGFICEIDNRLNKMEERMDELHFILKKFVNTSKLSVELSKDEQRVFLILYTHENFLKVRELSNKSFIDMRLIEDAISSIMDKGIPLEREILDGVMYFKMNNDFKLRQAKEQIIKIDPEVTGQFQNTLLQQFFTD